MERGRLEPTDRSQRPLDKANPSQGNASSASANAESEEEGEEREERESTREEREREEEAFDQHEEARRDERLAYGQFEKLFRPMADGLANPISINDFNVGERDELDARESDILTLLSQMALVRPDSQGRYPFDCDVIDRKGERLEQGSRAWGNIWFPRRGNWGQSQENLGTWFSDPQGWRVFTTPWMENPTTPRHEKLIREKMRKRHFHNKEERETHEMQLRQFIAERFWLGANQIPGLMSLVDKVGIGRVMDNLRNVIAESHLRFMTVMGKQAQKETPNPAEIPREPSSGEIDSLNEKLTGVLMQAEGLPPCWIRVLKAIIRNRDTPEEMRAKDYWSAHERDLMDGLGGPDGEDQQILKYFRLVVRKRDQGMVIAFIAPEDREILTLQDKEEPDFQFSKAGAGSYIPLARRGGHLQGRSGPRDQLLPDAGRTASRGEGGAAVVTERPHTLDDHLRGRRYEGNEDWEETGGGKATPPERDPSSQRHGVGLSADGNLSTGVRRWSGTNFNTALNNALRRNAENSEGHARQQFSSLLESSQQRRWTELDEEEEEPRREAVRSGGNVGGTGLRGLLHSEKGVSPNAAHSVTVTTTPFDPPRWEGPINDLTVTDLCRRSRLALSGQPNGTDAEGNKIPFTYNFYELMSPPARVILHKAFKNHRGGENAFEFLMNEDGSFKLDSQGRRIPNKRWWVLWASSSDCYKFLALAEDTFKPKVTDDSASPPTMIKEIFHRGRAFPSAEFAHLPHVPGSGANGEATPWQRYFSELVVDLQKEEFVSRYNSSSSKEKLTLKNHFLKVVRGKWDKVEDSEEYAKIARLSKGQTAVRDDMAKVVEKMIAEKEGRGEEVTLEDMAMVAWDWFDGQWATEVFERSRERRNGPDSQGQGRGGTRAHQPSAMPTHGAGHSAPAHQGTQQHHSGRGFQGGGTSRGGRGPGGPQGGRGGGQGQGQGRGGFQGGGPGPAGFGGRNPSYNGAARYAAQGSHQLASMQQAQAELGYREREHAQQGQRLQQEREYNEYMLADMHPQQAGGGGRGQKRPYSADSPSAQYSPQGHYGPAQQPPPQGGGQGQNPARGRGRGRDQGRGRGKGGGQGSGSGRNTH